MESISARRSAIAGAGEHAPGASSAASASAAIRLSRSKPNVPPAPASPCTRRSSSVRAAISPSTCQAVAAKAIWFRCSAHRSINFLRSLDRISIVSKRFSNDRRNDASRKASTVASDVLTINKDSYPRANHRQSHRQVRLNRKEPGFAGFFVAERPKRCGIPMTRAEGGFPSTVCRHQALLAIGKMRSQAVHRDRNSAAGTGRPISKP